MKKLRNHRAEKLLSIRNLGHRASVSPTTIYLIESGGRVPYLSTVQRLSDALNVRPEDVEEFVAAIEQARFPRQ